MGMVRLLSISSITLSEIVFGKVEMYWMVSIATVS